MEPSHPNREKTAHRPLGARFNLLGLGHRQNSKESADLLVTDGQADEGAFTALPRIFEGEASSPFRLIRGGLTLPSPRRPPWRPTVPPPDLRPPGGTNPSAQRVADGVGLRVTLFTTSSLALGGFAPAPFSLLALALCHDQGLSLGLAIADP